jgi:plasmid stabilization system protein ParE
MSYGVVFTPEAEEQLAELYRYIKDQASPEIALGAAKIYGLVCVSPIAWGGH